MALDSPAPYAIYRFEGFSGYLVSPEGSARALLSVRHSALVNPWSDSDVHMHTHSDEFYLLLHGRLDLLIDGQTTTLHPFEIVCVRAGVPHSVQGGLAPIEHFGFRAPSPEDRVVVAGSPGIGTRPPEPAEARELDGAWGYRVDLSDPKNRNCWLIGLGSARHHCPHFLFAYLDFPTHEAANAGIGTRLRLHLHRRSWEYYVCLQGRKTLQIENEELVVEQGQMVEVRPGVKHNVVKREAPYVGATFRVPLLDDKEEF